MSRAKGGFCWQDLNKLSGSWLRVRWLIYLSGAGLFFEKCLSRLLVLFATILIFLVASLFGLWQVVDGWIHLTLITAFYVGAIITVVRLVRVVKIPNVSESVRRLETWNRLSHQPIRTLLDYPAGLPNPSNRTYLLWEAHLKRNANVIASLAARRPSLSTPSRDPFGLVLTLSALTVLAFLVAGDGVSARLTAAHKVELPHLQEPLPGDLVAWINPPKYTNRAPIFLADSEGLFSPAEGGPQLVIAEGSTFVGRVYGGGAVPTLGYQVPLDKGEGPAAMDQKFEVADKDNYSIEHELLLTGNLVVKQGVHEHGAWSINVEMDGIPVVGFISPPETTVRASLKLTYKGEDDYGIEEMFAEISSIDGRFSPVKFDLDIPTGSSDFFEEAGFFDVASHPWAGFPASVELFGRDARGGVGKSEILEFELPVREFGHALARSIIDLRRRYAQGLADAGKTRSELEEIGPQLVFLEDPGFAREALRVAAMRLEFQGDENSSSEIIELLWEAAVWVEDGARADAEKALRAAEAALRRALDQNASNEKILELSHKLQDALAEFLESLDERQDGVSARSLVEIERELFAVEGEEVPIPSDQALRDAGIQVDPSSGEVAGSQQLQDMANSIEDLALTGSREAARTMLDQLQETLENLAGEGSNGEGTDEQVTGENDITSLEDLMGRQDALLNETFSQMRDDPSDVSEIEAVDTGQDVGQSGSELSPEEVAAGHEPPGMRDDEIERMDDLSGGQPAPTASRQSNSVQQSREPQIPDQNSTAGTQTSGEGEQGDMPASMTPPSLSDQAEERAGEEQDGRTSSQNSPGAGPGEGSSSESGNDPIAGELAGQARPEQPMDRQDRIREDLSDILRGEGLAGERIPVQLARAEKHMRDASEALRRERPDRAVRAQTKALHQLRQGVALLKGSRSGESGASATSQNTGQQTAEPERDPFGRESQDTLGSPRGFVDVPEMSEVQQSRIILDELYRRAGQPGRSQKEREYIERLLKWY
ncbi:MAG: DUF4175 family protein [Pseudomonadota bacterium]|nr:DUF4175 family protein [Pseudomonadota bacterium]